MAGSTATLLPIPYKLYTEEQVLEEDASVVNPMISSVLRCVRGGGEEISQRWQARRACVRAPQTAPSNLSPINYRLRRSEERGTRESMINHVWSAAKRVAYNPALFGAPEGRATPNCGRRPPLPFTSINSKL